MTKPMFSQKTICGYETGEEVDGQKDAGCRNQDDEDRVIGRQQRQRHADRRSGNRPHDTQHHLAQRFAGGAGDHHEGGPEDPVGMVHIQQPRHQHRQTGRHHGLEAQHRRRVQVQVAEQRAPSGGAGRFGALAPRRPALRSAVRRLPGRAASFRTWPADCATWYAAADEAQRGSHPGSERRIRRALTSARRRRSATARIGPHLGLQRSVFGRQRLHAFRAAGDQGLLQRAQAASERRPNLGRNAGKVRPDRRRLRPSAPTPVRC